MRISSRQKTFRTTRTVAIGRLWNVERQQTQTDGCSQRRAFGNKARCRGGMLIVCPYKLTAERVFQEMLIPKVPEHLYPSFSGRPKSGGGDNAFSFIGTSAFSGSKGELRTKQVGGNTYVQGDVDGDAAKDFEIELTGSLTLTAGDFLL